MQQSDVLSNLLGSFVHNFKGRWCTMLPSPPMGNARRVIPSRTPPRPTPILGVGRLESVSRKERAAQEACEGRGHREEQLRWISVHLLQLCPVFLLPGGSRLRAFFAHVRKHVLVRALFS